MKKLLIISITTIIFLFIIISPLLPLNCIHIYSNVKIMPDDVFKKVGNFYYVYQLKVPAEIQRKPLNIDVHYNEKIWGIIHFTDKDFAITEKGHIINKTEGAKNNLFTDFASKNWNGDFVLLFVNLNSLNIMSIIDKFTVKNKKVAFYDKNKIIVIMGEGNYKKKLKEYSKVAEMFKEKMGKIKEIDLQYKDQAVIKWREE